MTNDDAVIAHNENPCGAGFPACGSQDGCTTGDAALNFRGRAVPEGSARIYKKLALFLQIRGL